MTTNQLIKELIDSEKFKYFRKSKHGLERECLRVKRNGKLATTPHPPKFGSPLTNSFLNTDFAEPQLELVTKPHYSEQDALKALNDIHLFVNGNLSGELIWAGSMPAILPENHEEIPLAQYGTSTEGLKKTLYRRGLGHRYGRKMQTISGAHYNFSLPPEILNFLYARLKQKGESQQDFKTRTYLKIIRNFLELSWMDTYLFGASPAIDSTYLNQKPSHLKKLGAHTYVGPHATSLRMSPFGYHCAVQDIATICYNSLSCFLKDLTRATSTPYPRYSEIGVYRDGEKLQLNDYILQIPNEYYSSIRPKQLGHDILKDLAQKGIEYVEVRSLDLNPFTPLGITGEHLQFLHILLIHCLLKKDQSLSAPQQLQMLNNHDKVALFGRKKGLTLLRANKKIALKKWALQEFEEMEQIAVLLDQNHHDKRYQKTLKVQIEKIHNSDLTPSAQVLSEVKKHKSFRKFILTLAKKHLKYFQSQKLPPQKLQQFQTLAQKSLQKQREIEQEELSALELSTQLLIEEAKRQNIEVEILDHHENIIRLKKGKEIEIVKQATITSKNPSITYQLMGNKAVTKILLQEHEICAPNGRAYFSAEEAVKDYRLYSGSKTVIKPTTSNYGIGLTFCEKDSFETYQNGIKEAFKHDSSILIEQFIEGEEYRLLVIGNNVAAISHRIPANVIGDGKSTISQLIDKKNLNKRTKYYLKKGKTEAEKLAQQNFTFKSVPAKNQLILLRDNSNVSTGGDSIDATSNFPQKFKTLAIKAAKLFGAEICGIDIVINKDHAYFIELNYNPSLLIHYWPDAGKPRPVAKNVLELLGF